MSVLQPQCASCGAKVVGEIWIDAAVGYHCGNCIRQTYARLKALEAVVAAAAALVDKLRLAFNDSQYQAVWTMYESHGGNYTGPTCTDELTVLCAALDAVKEAE